MPEQKQPKQAAGADKPIGRVTHYLDQLKVAVVKLERGKSLKLGEVIRIEGGEGDFTQKIESLQVDHKDVKQVSASDDFGMKTDRLVHEGYRVYRA